jgi:hypothetical protein
LSKQPSPGELEKLVAEFLATVLGLRVQQNEHGFFIKVSPSIAYEFSVFTGAAYCTNPDFPFSAKPFSKIFGKALEFSFTSSMFDRGVARYSFENLLQKYPFIASGEKRIFFKAYSEESQLRNFRELLCAVDPFSSDILLFRIEYWKTGFGLEPLLEYAASKALIDNGYIVENQTPLSSRLGSPDLLAFRSQPLQKLLSSFLGLPPGFSLASLSSHFYLALPKHERTITSRSDDDSIVVVGEAKVGGAKANKQIKKYLDSGYFDLALFLTDSCSNSVDHEWFELCTNGFTQQFPLPNLQGSRRTEIGKEYLKWLTTVTLSHLFFGVPRERQETFLDKLGAKASSTQIPEFIHNLGAEAFIEEFVEVLQ